TPSSWCGAVAPSMRARTSIDSRAAFAGLVPGSRRNWLRRPGPPAGVRRAPVAASMQRRRGRLAAGTPLDWSARNHQAFSMSKTYPPVSLIGAPTDIGAGHRGALMGPDALRIAGLGEALSARGIDVADRGNLPGPSNPWQPPVDGYRHLDEVVAW